MPVKTTRSMAVLIDTYTNKCVDWFVVECNVRKCKRIATHFYRAYLKYKHKYKVVVSSNPAKDFSKYVDVKKYEETLTILNFISRRFQETKLN